ncbi:MAG TPA: energy transducer TonB [Gemmatimonadaceae bacterium]|nr:energy transducer TonB [Gemmatimonadaceae bacterium]
MNILDTSHVYGGLEVDKPAEAYRNNPTIPWPGTRDQTDNGTAETDQRDAKNASVIARFVVDTMGCVDSTSFKVVSASDSAFSKAVQQYITKLHYKPAQRGDQKVRSWVLWKFLLYRANGSEIPGTH